MSLSPAKKKEMTGGGTEILQPAADPKAGEALEEEAT